MVVEYFEYDVYFVDCGVYVVFVVWLFVFG